MHITIKEAMMRLKAGEVVALPTETVYGLAADASNEEALAQIYAIKQRPSSNPLIVHIADAQAVEHWAAAFPPLAQTIAKAFWPGPLTIVLKAAPHVLPIVTANQPTIALRVPNHPTTLSILKQSGLGLAAPSANRYTQISPTKSQHVMAGFGVQLPIVDGGDCKVGIESTIVEVFDDDQGQSQWRILREGMITLQDINRVVKLAASPLPQVNQVKVPGQHRLHYAPKTPLTVCDTRLAMLSEIKATQKLGKKVAALALDSLPSGTIMGIALPAAAADYAKQFYAALHELDALNVDVILVERPPLDTEWMPLLDRMHRASH